MTTPWRWIIPLLVPAAIWMLPHGGFDAHGGLTRANGDRFRRMILSRGNTVDYGVMFREFTGHDPEIGPMIKNRGLGER